MKPLYIIPARGGSKSIPRKNIRPLGGKPLIAYTIAAALEATAQLGGHVMLSTDDTEIASVARSCGLTVDYMRPASLGLDTTGSREVMLDAMDWATAHGICYDCVILLQPTSPLRTAGHILEAAQLYDDAVRRSEHVDMVTSVCPSGVNPYYNLFETDADGYMHVCKGHGLYTRRQDCPEVYQQNGAVYVINPQSLRKMNLGEFPRRIPHIMPAECSIDLDTPADWEAAEKHFLK